MLMEKIVWPVLFTIIGIVSFLDEMLDAMLWLAVLVILGLISFGVGSHTGSMELGWSTLALGASLIAIMQAR
jgi:hypothetical protein